MTKIIKLKDVSKYISPYTAVITGGGYDLIHVGHIRFLKKCSELGRPLIAIVQSDLTLKKRKGPNRPIVNQKERAEIVASLAYVDYVIILEKPFYSESYIKAIKPKTLAFSKENVKFRQEILKLIKKKFSFIEGAFLPKQSEHTSTSSLIKRIISLEKKAFCSNDKILRTLHTLAALSESKLGKTSALIMHGEKIIAENCNELEKHAEEITIDKAKKLGIPLFECEIYTLLSPCLICAREIIKSKITKAYYIHSYGTNDGIKLLKKKGVVVEKYKEKQL